MKLRKCLRHSEMTYDLDKETEDMEYNGFNYQSSRLIESSDSENEMSVTVEKRSKMPQDKRRNVVKLLR